MQVDLIGLIQSATGPWGGRASHLKLVTRKDGQVLVVPRKTSMTGSRIWNIMEWAKLNWILVDCMWRNSPPRFRVEWGKCTRRTTDLATSNLDMFRKINMPRAMLGFPLLTLPPDKFHSWCTYVPRPEQHSRHNKKPPQQVWVQGLQKPDPPWTPSAQEPEDPYKGAGPPDPLPFTPLRGPIANPMVSGATCASGECPENPLYCYDELICYLPIPFEPQLDKNYFRWLAWTNPEKTHRNPIWDIKTEILSKRIWYDSRPYYKVTVSNVQCYEGSMYGHNLPWPRAWGIRIQYYSAPGVLLCWGYYWRDTADCCPDGTWELAWYDNIYGSFPWPEHILLQASGTLLAEPPCCPDIWNLGWQDHCPSGLWVANDDIEQWAGFTWYWLNNRFAEPFWRNTAGPAAGWVTEIRCHETGLHAGHWVFTVQIKRAGNFHFITYRRPVTAANPGIFGVYMKYDPANLCPWGAYGMQISDYYKDWNDVYPSLGYRIFEGVTIYCCLYVLGYFANRALSAAAVWSGMAQPYSHATVSSAIMNSRDLASALAHGTWRCQITLKHGAMHVGREKLTRAAAHRIIGKVISGF